MGYNYYAGHFSKNGKKKLRSDYYKLPVVG